MFIDDLGRDFYGRLVGKRVLVIVNYDIDALCASRILQALFQNDHILYSIVPIMGISGLQRTYTEHREDAKNILLVNCGGCIDILETLQPEEDATFFICDSHRPYDVCNIYNDGQIKILGKPSEDEGIPEFETIFRDSDSEESDSENEDEEEGEQMTRMQKFEAKMEKQRQRRVWETDRNRIMFEYSQFSYYGRSSALQLFELAWRLSKDSLDILWWAIVGVTEQLVMGKIESAAYTLECNQIQSHVSRLTNKASDNTIQTAVRITFENDLHLAMYRHWSVQDSLRHSIYSACKMRLWTLHGEKRLQELLVEMGLPLVQARQTFSSMDLVLRQEFYGMIEKLAEKYDLTDLIYGSFTLHYGYRHRYSAADYVYSLLANLESVGADRLPEQCFLEAMDSLERVNRGKLHGGIERAKQLLVGILRHVQGHLEMRQVRSAGPFLYYTLTEESNLFCCPYSLTLLTQFILRAHVSASRSRRAPDMPLVASCPVDVERGICLMIGIPPTREDSPKNLFGRAFEQAALKSSATISPDFFDTACIQIKRDDQQRFLDALTVLLS
ncbi:cell division control protein 45 homolog [Phlebotomus argentipes]|uniref:cell division control protein 45 homolog n=1 Tax=Phlebotomus argentipes TaxID=94469 RepID=UPI00289342B4|nr:cell division control protein 45 homolog [Phlebotomus argentipes]